MPMQPQSDDADIVVMTVRVNRALRRQIEDAARSSFRPLSGEIAHRIKLSFESRRDQLHSQLKTKSPGHGKTRPGQRKIDADV